MPKDFNNDKFNISKRLKSKAELSDDQVETVMTWLSKNEDKKIDFVLKFYEKIEMELESGVVEKKESSIQSWSWSKIEDWMDNM